MMEHLHLKSSHVYKNKSLQKVRYKNCPEKKGEAHSIWGIKTHFSFCIYLINSINEESVSLSFWDAAFAAYLKHGGHGQKYTSHQKAPNRKIYIVICYKAQIVSCYHSNLHSLLWESILNKDVRKTQLKIINETAFLVPLDSLIKFINELSIRYSETKKVTYEGIFNAIKVHHLHFTSPLLAAGSRLKRIK